MLARTLDDRPDPEWTPPILDRLDANDVPATFFVIGENAMSHPFLTRRIVAESSESGNHNFTHPNLAMAAAKGNRTALNNTRAPNTAAPRPPLHADPRATPAAPPRAPRRRTRRPGHSPP